MDKRGPNESGRARHQDPPTRQLRAARPGENVQVKPAKGREIWTHFGDGY
jgi:hypothetical protein